MRGSGSVRDGFTSPSAVGIYEDATVQTVLRLMASCLPLIARA